MPAESFNEALIDCVKACGGSKVVGLAIWPAKGVEPAQRQLLACLNPDRSEKLSLDELLLILRLARIRGCHTGMEFLSQTLSYADPAPVEPKDEADALSRQVLEMGRSLQAQLERLQRLRAVA